MKAVQKKPREKKADQDSQTKPKVRFLYSFFTLPHTSTSSSLPHCCAANCRSRGGRGGRSGGPTLGHVAKRKAPRRRKTATARRSRARRRRAKRRMTATRTTRWSGAERGGTATERGGALTRRRPRTTTCLPTTIPANTAVFQITRSWWVQTGDGLLVRFAVIDSRDNVCKRLLRRSSCVTRATAATTRPVCGRLS